MSQPTMIVAETVTVTGNPPQSRSITLTASNQIINNPASVPAAYTGTLTTRGSSTAGTLTMDSSGHGITDATIFAIFWNGGSCYATAASPSGTSVPFTTGVGTALPVNNTLITASVFTQESAIFTGNNAKCASIYSNLGSPGGTADYNAIILYTTSNGTTVAGSGAAVWTLTAAIPNTSWDGTGVGANPFTGSSVAIAQLAHGNTTTRVLGAITLYN